MTEIHPTALVAKGARLGVGVRVGPYCIVGDEVELEDGVWLRAHVVLEGRARLGRGVVVHPFAVLGGAPQDLKYQGEPTELVIGARTVVRESVTISRGTGVGGGLTRVGEGCLLMAGVHVAHDCRLGDGVVLSNGAALGGHVEVGDRAVLGAFAGIHQFARVGELAMVGAGAMVSLDVPPYCLAQGDRARLMGLNTVGLRRAGWSAADLRAARRAVKLLLTPGGDRRAASSAARLACPGPHTERLVAFIAQSRRGVCRLRGTAGTELLGGEPRSARAPASLGDADVE